MTLVSTQDKVDNSVAGGTARDHSISALRRLNIYSPKEEIPDEDVRFVLSELNSMLQSWVYENAIVSFSKYNLNDVVGLNIGGNGNFLYFDDVIIYNLCMRLIEVYDATPRAFQQISDGAKTSLDMLINMKRNLEGDFQSDFDKTLSNTPNNRHYYGLMRGGE